MKKLHLKKISETAKKIASWCNVRKRIDEHNYKLFTQAIDEAEHDFYILYHAVKGKIYDGEPLEDVASWYDEEKHRIIHKYGVIPEILEHTTFRDIYNGDYLIMQQARTGHCDGEIIQEDPDDDDFWEEYLDERKELENWFNGIDEDEAIIGDISDFEENPDAPF